MKKVVMFVLSIALCLSFVGCGTGGGASDDTIVIGYIGPLTGESSAFGTPELNTMEMLVEEINESGGVNGYQIELKSYDNRSDNVETTNAAKRAITADNVSALIGCPTSGSAIALAEVCDEYNVPFVATCATSIKVTEDDDGNVRPYAFRSCLTDPAYGTIMAQYLYNELGLTTAGILQEVSSDYSVGIAEAFTEAYTNLGGEVVAVENYTTGDVEFRAQLTVLQEANPQALFLPMLYKELALCVQQARGLGMEQLMCGPDCWTNLDLIGMAGEGIYGSYHVDGFNFDDPSTQEFDQKYEELYGVSARLTGANAYMTHDALMLILAAVEECGSREPTDIRDTLEGIEDVQGISCKLSIDEEHHVIRDAIIYESGPDGQVPIETFTITYDD